MGVWLLSLPSILHQLQQLPYQSRRTPFQCTKGGVRIGRVVTGERWPARKLADRFRLHAHYQCCFPALAARQVRRRQRAPLDHAAAEGSSDKTVTSPS